MTRPEVESAEAFAERLADTIEVGGGGVWSQSVSHTAETLALVTARDAAIRAAALEDAALFCEEWARGCAAAGSGGQRRWSDSIAVRLRTLVTKGPSK